MGLNYAPGVQMLKPRDIYGLFESGEQTIWNFLDTNVLFNLIEILINELILMTNRPPTRTTVTRFLLDRISINKSLVTWNTNNDIIINWSPLILLKYHHEIGISWRMSNKKESKGERKQLPNSLFSVRCPWCLHT